MSYLLDTNIVVRWADAQDANHILVASCISSLYRQSEHLFICPQNLIEFWAVATRSRARNGLDWTLAETKIAVDKALNQFTFLPDTDAIFGTWLKAVEEKGIVGVKVHDARVASIAITNNIFHLLTINVDDFKRFTELNIMHPADVPLVS